MLTDTETLERSSAGKDGAARGRLFLSGISQDFDVDRDLALGPWCFVGLEDRVPDWEELPFFDAFESEAELRRAASQCEALLRHRITRLAGELNARHGVNHSFAYWWTLSARWMNHLIAASWRRWVHLGKFIEIHGGRPLVVPVFADAYGVDWNFRDTASFYANGLLSHRFDFWLWSLCLARLAPGTWTLTPVSEDDRPPEKGYAPPPHRTNVFRRFLRRRLGRVAFTDVPTASAAAIGLLSVYLSVLPRRSAPVFRGEPLDRPPDGFPESFLSLVDTLATRTMPLSLTDDYARRAGALSGKRFHRGRLFVNGSATINDDSSFQIAHAIEAGERVVRVQHGSDYGTMGIVNIEASGEYMNDAFLSWGWTVQDGRPGRFVPVPAPGLSRFRNRHRQTNDAIIMVGTRMLLRSYRVDHAQQPAQVIEYRREKAVFVKALDEQVLGRLLYRGYSRGNSDIKDTAYVKRHAPDIGTCDGDFEEAFLGCRLLVLDHPGTTLNEVMAANVPTVCFWDHDAWLIAPEAEPFFQALREARILFADGASAARHVNAVAGDVAAWWNAASVQEARTAWTDRFAHTRPLWWWHWMRALARL